MTKQIYLDNAAATQIDDRVVKAINDACHLYANPSAINRAGGDVARAIDLHRQTIAKFLGVKSSEVVFVSSGTEANNLAILGVLSARINLELVTTQTEHKSVLEPAKMLQKKGHKIIYCSVDKDGVVNIEQIKNSLNKRTGLVSVSYVNNETGVIQPVREIGKLIKEFRKQYNTKLPLFHVDACQATAYLPVRPNEIGADLLTINGSKIYGPRGIGVLFISDKIKLNPLIFGGGQEKGLRPGTESVQLIAGMGKAIAVIDKNDAGKIRTIRETFEFLVIKNIQGAVINGSKAERVCGISNISFKNVDGERLLVQLDKEGIMVSAGSACTAKGTRISHVLKAMGLPTQYAKGTIRFSFGRFNEIKDAQEAFQALGRCVRGIR